MEIVANNDFTLYQRYQG